MLLAPRRRFVFLAALCITGPLLGHDAARAAPRRASLAVITRSIHHARRAPLGPVSVGSKTYYQYSFDGHVHTRYSHDADHPVSMVLGAGEQSGLDAIVVTDHGSTLAQRDFAEYRGKLVPFAGQEIGGLFGHAVMWNVHEDDKQDPLRTTLEQRARFAHERGGLLVLAHPGWWIKGNSHDPMGWVTAQALRRGGKSGSIDALEIWNGVYRTPLPKLVDAWVAILAAGVFVPVVGDSDFHRFSAHHLGSARNVVYCDEPDIHTCLWPAIRKGQSYVSDGPSLLFTVNDLLPGSVIEAHAGDILHVSAQATAPDGGELRVYLGDQVIRTQPLAADQVGAVTFDVPAPDHDSFLRVDVARSNPSRGQTPISLLSNPVLLNAGSGHVWR